MPKIALRTARELSGYSIDEVARICGVSLSTIRRYEGNPGLTPLYLMITFTELYGKLFI